MPAIPFIVSPPLIPLGIGIRSTSIINNTNTPPALQVVCAWPVSGQYGPGSRVLYYVLVATCVFGRQSPLLQKASLAAALLFPAVAALHGIVLAAVHVDGAIDMDVFGAFQLCAIGILAAPVTVRLSETYFRDPRRDTIFVWTGLVFSGLLSLTIEFFRANPTDCVNDNSGGVISLDSAQFPYGAMCGLTCTIKDGPFSPLRDGSANDIYVIPVPTKLSFNTARLLAAACCLPAILSLVSIWNKIVVTKWNARRSATDEEQSYMPISPWIQTLLNRVEVPVFGSAVIAILIIGELNFFSYQVNYQTERMPSIGQWAPVAGTALGILWSLYLVAQAKLEAARKEDQSESTAQGMQGERSGAATTANQRRVARFIDSIGNTLTNIGPESFSWGELARNYPSTPGEAHRSPSFHRDVEQFNSIRQQPSRAASLRESINSRPPSFEGGQITRERSPSRPCTEGSRSPLPSSTAAQRPHDSSVPILNTTLPEQRKPDSASSAGPVGVASRQRRDTLEVPSPVRLHHNHTWKSRSDSSAIMNDIVGTSQSPPAIVISPDSDEAFFPSPSRPDSTTPPSPLQPLKTPRPASLRRAP